jgi:hypothetical protein
MFWFKISSFHGPVWLTFVYTHALDLFPNEQNFDLDKSRQKSHHSLNSLKEHVHHKISNIPTFRCEML